MMNIGENIRRLRRNMDATQEDLARYVQCSSQAVSKWECGESLPDITLLPVLAAFFNVTADELLGMDREMKSRGTGHMLRDSRSYMKNSRISRSLRRTMDCS